MGTRSFLDLPAPVRLRIYRLCGLTRPCPIDLVPPRPSCEELQLPRPRGASTGQQCYFSEKMKHAFSTNSLFHSRMDCACPKIPLGLFLVSKATYNDTHATFYRQNKFVVRAHKATHFATLESLTPQAIAAMAFLLIRLNCWPCPWGHDEVYLDGTCQVCSTPIGDSDPVLQINTQAGQELAKTWEKLCTKLSDHIMPGQLDFTFICDTKSKAVAERVTAPLATFPLLKKCAIRLGRPDLTLPRKFDLRSIARDVSLKATQEFMPQKSFPWEKLPRELRLQILNYTHLGSLGNYPAGLTSISILDGLLRGHHNTYKCCSKCTSTFADCCCPSSHASYSASCECRIWPWELFTISKQMYTDAFEVFYSKNPFYFNGEPISTIKFLEGFPTGAVSLIRHLIFSFGESDVTEWEERGLPEKWSKFVEFIKLNMNVPLLSITIDLEDSCGIFEFNDDDSTNGTEEENLWAKFVYDIYWYLARSLFTLEGLGNVRFQLGYWFDLKPLLEQRVMGERWREKLFWGDRREDREAMYGGFWEPMWALPPWHLRFYKEAAGLD